MNSLANAFSALSAARCRIAIARASNQSVAPRFISDPPAWIMSACVPMRVPPRPVRPEGSTPMAARICSRKVRPSGIVASLFSRSRALPPPPPISSERSEEDVGVGVGVGASLRYPSGNTAVSSFLFYSNALRPYPFAASIYRPQTCAQRTTVFAEKLQSDRRASRTPSRWV